MKYSDFSAQFAAHREKQHDYWRKLQTAVMNIRQDFESSLDLQRKNFDEDGDSLPYVQVGVLEGTRFIRTHPFSIPGTNELTLPFAVSLTLEEGPNVSPRSSYCVSGEIRYKGGEFIFTPNWNGEEIRIVGSKGTEDFGPLIEEMKSVIFRAISPDIFPS